MKKFLLAFVILGNISCGVSVVRNGERGEPPSNPAPTPVLVGDINLDGLANEDDDSALDGCQLYGQFSGCEKGDLNQDGQWTFEDRILLMPHLNFSSKTALAADINGDKKANERDFVFVSNCSTSGLIDFPICVKADFNSDGMVDTLDIQVLASEFQSSLITQKIYVPRFNAEFPADTNGDGFMNTEDINFIARCFGESIVTNPYCKNADLNSDGIVAARDYSVIISILKLLQ